MNDLIVKSNVVVEASYALTTLEQRLVLSAIAQIPKGVPVQDDIVYYVSTEDFVALGSHERNAHRDLKEAARKLYQREIITTVDGMKVATRWIQQKAEPLNASTNLYAIRFSTPLLPYLTNLSKEFTQYLKNDVAGIKGAYTIRFYEMLCQYRSTGKRKMHLDDIRTMLRLEDTYKHTADLKRRVIDPSIKELNKKTPINATCEYCKTGNKITHVLFKFKHTKPLKRSKQANFEKEIRLSKTEPSWMKKGLSDKQINKIGVHKRDFIDYNNDKDLLYCGGAPRNADYDVIFESWKPILKDPTKVNKFKRIQEILERPVIY